MLNKLLVISGPTATGKTDLAVELAKKYNGELVSGDSCQIYKGMDIGTGKDQPDETPIHLIDIITPDQKFSVADFQKLAIETIKEIQSHGKLPILVGCSGFYIDSVINPTTPRWRFTTTSSFPVIPTWVHPRSSRRTSAIADRTTMATASSRRTPLQR